MQDWYPISWVISQSAELFNYGNSDGVKTARICVNRDEISEEKTSKYFHFRSCVKMGVSEWRRGSWLFSGLRPRFLKRGGQVEATSKNSALSQG